MSVGNQTFDVTVKAPGPLPQEWKDKLNRVVVSDGNQLPAVAEVSFDDPDGKLVADTKLKPGAKLTVEVKVSSSSSAVKLFVGEVVGFQVTFDGNGSLTTICAEDAGHRLMRGSKVVNHQNRTASQIVRKTANDAGIPVGTVAATTPILEAKAQNSVSPWRFLQDLAAENHMELAVVEGKLQFKTPTKAATAPSPSTPARSSPFVIDRQSNLLSLHGNATAVDQVSAVTARGWNTATKKEIKRQVKVTASDEQQPGVTPKAAATPFGTKELLVTDEPYRTVAEAKTAATAAADDHTGSFVDLEMVIRGTPQVRAGVAIALTNVGTPFNGKYTVSSTRHVLVPKVFYETEVMVSGGNDRSTLGLVTGAAAKPRSNTLGGLEWGVVTNVKAGRGPGNKHPEQVNQPWVKLRFPLLAGAADYETGWVPTVQPGGVGGGGVLCPEVNDVVIVGFLGGLLDYPVVLGGVYVGGDKPAPLDGNLVDNLTGKVNVRMISSRDGQAVEVLSAKAPGPTGVRLRTDKNKLLIHLDDRSQRNPVIKINSDGSVEIKASKAITLTGTDITLDAGDKLMLKGKRVWLEGTTTTRVNGATVLINC